MVCRPEEALSDGQQALLPHQYEEVMSQIRDMAALLKKEIPEPHGSAAAVSR